MACNSQYDRIMRDCRIVLPGALDDVIKEEFFNVADEFFKTTQLWQETIALGVSSGQRFYDIESNEWLAVVDMLMSVDNGNGIPVHAQMCTPGQLELRYDPTDGGIYNVKVALTVAECDQGRCQCGCGSAGCTNGFPQVPQWILQKYRGVFTEGVQSRMMGQLAKPYYNEKLGIYHGQRFRSGMSYARIQGARQNTYNNQVWTFPYYADGRKD